MFDPRPTPAGGAPGIVAIAGAGRMGAQIGAEYALAGHPTILITRTGGTGDRALEQATAAIRLLVDEGLATEKDARAAVGRLATATDLSGACLGAEIVVESVAEDFEAKVTVLTAAGGAAPDAILATNTSSLSIGALGDAAGVADRLIGTHYWNPPTLMPLVEVVSGPKTATTVRDRMLETLRRLGKDPVLVTDAPGFVWNRLQFALLREAAALVADGVVSASDLDRIVARGLARRWSLVGPFDTMDLGGRETFLAIARGLFRELSDGTSVDDLAHVPASGLNRLAELARERDRGLAELRRREHAGPGRSGGAE
ncbi:MAG: 3-hydroxyacyl-CoA dehydrogenase family protein [Candidatus Limnocylindria bacterium]